MAAASGRGWVRVAIGLGALMVVAAGLAGFRAWSHDAAFGRARADLDARRFGPALEALEALDAARPVWALRPPGEFDYTLGYARWIAGRRKAALAALARVPESSDFANRADVLRAEAEMQEGRWRDAEDRLVHAYERGPRNRTDIRAGLDRLYRMQARFEDAAGVLRDGWAESPDPARTLRDLWTTERGTPPYDAIGRGLEEAGRLAPDDDRIWLGKARVATAAGRLDEARTWLEKCQAHRPDEAVARAWLEWGRVTDRADVVGRAIRAIGADGLKPVEWIGWRIWYARRDGNRKAERAALRTLLRLEPRRPEWLDLAAGLAAESGEADSAASLRARKAEVDRALTLYGQRMSAAGKGAFATAADRIEMGRIAEAAGRRFDARAWYRLALRAEPRDAVAAFALAELDATEPKLFADRPADPDPWGWSEPPARPDADADATAAAPAGPALRFDDDAARAGLVHTYRNGETPIRQMPVALGGGVGLIDFDGDGDLDVYAAQGGPFPPESGSEAAGDRLFANRGDGTFEDATGGAGLPSKTSGYGHGVAVGDVDGDGRPDLFVTRWRSYGLYLNRGGRFEDATASWGLGGDRDWPTSAAFADLDDDGDLDLYVCHYVVWDEANPRLCKNGLTGAYMSCNPTTCPARPDHLFRNDGGRFVDVSESAGVTAADADGRGLGVVAADLDDDGRVDLFVANDKSANFLFRNLGGLKFEEVAQQSGVAGNAQGGYQAGMGAACADLDGDGRPDLLVTNYYGESTSLFRNLGGGVFQDQTAPSGLGAASRLRLGFGIAAFDADNDGRVDVLTANGHTDDLGDTPYRMPAQLLRNVGKGRLTDATAASGEALGVARLGRGLAAGDLDGDGRIDALLVDQNAPMAYLRNRTGRAGGWLAFRLEGTASNRDGVGAVVTVESGGVRRTGRRLGGGSYLSADDPRVHFGLGDAAGPLAVSVRWPSGRVDEHRDLRPGAVYHLREGGGATMVGTPR